MPEKEQSLEWFDQCLVNMQVNLEHGERDLARQMKAVVETRQDIVCLTNLLRKARDKGKLSMPTNWREKQFKGRR